LTTTLDPSGSSDLAFESGSENNPDGWVISSAPAASLDPKARIKANWSYSYADSSFAHNYLALSFYRASGSGNADIDFELNQNGPADVYTNSQGTSVVCRKNGDVLIAFQPQSSASTTAQVNIYKWQWNAGGAPCTAGATGAFSPLVAPAGVSLAEGAMNSSAVTNYLSVSALGSTFGQSTFGETAVDLTALANVLAPSAGCEFFNHMQLTTRSSSSTLNSSMEDFVDKGAVVVPACVTPGNGGGSGGGTGGGGTGGGGGGSCSTSPSVAITSPASGTTVDSSTVVLNGSSSVSNGTVVVYDGTTAVGFTGTDGTGGWTVSLNGVADGPHGYTAVVRDSNACPGGSGAAVKLIVSGSSSGGGTGAGGSGGSGGARSSGPGGSGVSGSGSSSNNGSSGQVGAWSSASGAWLACTNQRTLSVADVYPWGGKARLTGFAPVGSVGKTVKIIAAWNHKVIGSATVLVDNSFRVSVPLPPAHLRATALGAYLARLGTQTSAPLTFARRLYNTRIQIRFVKQKVTTTVIKRIGGKLRRVKVTKVISAQTITFVGTVMGPYASPRQSVVIRGSNTCANVGSGPVLARAKVNAHGRFKVSFKIPQSLLRYQVIFVRAQTVVAAPRGKQANVRRSKLVPTYGITRGVHI
jgi:hypothetical protein